MAKKTGGLNKAKGLDALISANRTGSSLERRSSFLKAGKTSVESTEELAKKTPSAESAAPETKTAPAEPAALKKSAAERKKEPAQKKAPAEATADPVGKAQAEIQVPELDEKDIITVKLSSVVPNREQPRRKFDDASLEELAQSIALHGVIVPLLVRKKEKYYEIIAGERRWRAAKLAKVREIPVIVREYSDAEASEIALIENIQREDLNPIEEAAAYQKLMEDFGLTQEMVAQKVSKSRAAVANSLRLLKLDERVRRLLIDGLLTMGHARALLAIENPEAQFDVANTVILRKMSVRETESYVKRLGRIPKEAPVEDTIQLDAAYEEAEEALKAVLGTKIKINRKKSGKGSIQIEYYSVQELERLLTLLKSVQAKG